MKKYKKVSIKGIEDRLYDKDIIKMMLSQINCYDIPGNVLLEPLKTYKYISNIITKDKREDSLKQYNSRYYQSKYHLIHKYLNKQLETYNNLCSSNPVFLDNKGNILDIGDILVKDINFETLYNDINTDKYKEVFNEYLLKCVSLGFNPITDPHDRHWKIPYQGPDDFYTFLSSRREINAILRTIRKSFVTDTCIYNRDNVSYLKFTLKPSYDVINNKLLFTIESVRYASNVFIHSSESTNISNEEFKLLVDMFHVPKPNPPKRPIAPIMPHEMTSWTELCAYKDKVKKHIEDLDIYQTKLKEYLASQ